MNEPNVNASRTGLRVARAPRKDVYLRVRISKVDRLAIYQAATEHLATIGGFVRGVVLDYVAKNPKGPRS